MPYSVHLITEEDKIMKAAKFYNKFDLRIEDLTEPEVGENDVLIKVHACGICGTDMHIFDGDEGAAATPSGTVLGHEFSGEILKVGRRVADFKAGDRVCVDPNKLCGKCRFCKGGIGHFCEHITGIGTTVNGGFSEMCRVPESQCYKIPDSLSYEEAAMTEPVACCLHGIDLCNIRHGDTVAVIGAGMIGLIMTQLAKLAGACNIIVIEPVESKRVHAKKLGADIVLNPNGAYIPEVLAKLAQYELTLKDWVRDHKGYRKYVTLTGKCWPAFQTQFGFVPCYVNSRLTAQGIPVSCEVDIYGTLSEFIGQVVSDDIVTLLDINNSVPKDMYKESIEGKFNYTLQDTFMGFHCGNTASSKLSFCEMKYQMIMARSLPVEVTNGTLEGDIKPGDITFYRLQSSADN